MLSISLLQDPGLAVLLDANRALLIQTNATRIEDGSREHRVRDGRQARRVIVGRLRLLRVNTPRRVYELFNRNIAVTALAVKVAALRRRILHAGI